MSWLAVLAALAILSKTGGKSSNNPNNPYAYSDMPSACICHTCGYRVESPGKHCPQLGACPKCGASRLWRER